MSGHAVHRSLSCISIALCACAGPLVSIRRGYDFGKVRRVAVLDFKDHPGAAGSGETAAAAFEKHLLAAGYEMVERREVELLLGEQALGASGAVDPRQVREVGRLLQVDALLLGGVTAFSREREETVLVDVREERREPVVKTVRRRVKQGEEWVEVPEEVVAGYTTTRTRREVPEGRSVDARVGVSARLVDVQTGSVLWSGSTAATAPTSGEAADEAARRVLKAVRDTWPAGAGGARGG